MEPRAPKAPRNEAFIDALALRLRTLATDFENTSQMQVLLQPALIKKTTAAQEVIANANVVILRDGLVIAYRNVNSKTGKVSEIRKSWNQILGCTPDSYTFYITDSLWVEILDVPKEDELFFNIAWQALAFEMNGNDATFKDPKISTAGHSLRSAARYLQENYKDKAIPRTLDLEEIVDEAPMDDEVVVVPRPATQKFTSLPKVGDVVGGYKIEASIGGGGFGAVFQAKSKYENDTVVALKLMRLKEGMKVDSVKFHRDAQDFLEEAKMSSNFPHDPFIVTPIDYGISPWPWIAYPLLRGSTVGSKGPLSDEKWWNLAHDVLSGLADIHQSNVIHSDIKNDNIMDIGSQFKILDFGISYIPGFVRTGAGKGGGTFPFAAPEILPLFASKATGVEPHPSIDIFSVGVLLYLSKTGSYPFKFTNGPIELEVQSRKTIEIDENYFDEQQVSLLRKLLDNNPDNRITAANALKVVAPHVDIEAKTKLIENALLKTYREKAAENISLEETSENYELEGPFASWKNFETLLIDALEQKRPRYFTINFYDIAGKSIFYVQAYFEKTCWHIETPAQKFLPKRLQTPKQKQAIIDLGWNPPTKDAPNYHRETDGVSPSETAALFVDAIERGYGWKPSEFSKFVLVTRGEGHY